MYNYSNLRDVINKKKYTQRKLAKEIGIEHETLNRKLNNHKDFTQSEIEKIKNILKLKDVDKYFFTT